MSLITSLPQLKPATRWLTSSSLRDQNRSFRNTGGVSQQNRSSGFAPAFVDTQTGQVYLSRFANGGIAPIHVLEGLPASLVAERSPAGRVVRAKESVTAGFVRDGIFYTRQQAAAAVARDQLD